MQDLSNQYPRQALERYAKKRLASETQSQTIYRFKPYACPVCGLTAFEFYIEHHSGSTRRNFRGAIRGICSNCGEKRDLFHFTGQHRKPEQEKTLKCTCGSKLFFAGECEHVENDQDLPGFVDEGIAVAACAQCGRLSAIVEWD